MARGNQREKAREKNQKAQAGVVSALEHSVHPGLPLTTLAILQKNKNNVRLSSINPSRPVAFIALAP